MNSIIDEDISEDNPEEFFAGYLSRHNNESNKNIEGTVNNVRGSFIVGTTMNSFYMKDRFQTAAFMVKDSRGSKNSAEYDDINRSNEEMIVGDFKRRDTALPVKVKPILRTGSDVTTGSNPE